MGKHATKRAKVTYLILGLVVGIAVDAFFLHQGRQGVTIEEASTTDTSGDNQGCKQELAALQARFSKCELMCQTQKNAGDARSQELYRDGKTEIATEKSESNTKKSATETQAANNQTLQWRVSAIEKFIPITTEQRERLIRKFEAEKGPDGDAAESLEDILGIESAAFYRQQVDSAFRKAKFEALDREFIWLSRQLGLSSQQEDQLQGIFYDVEDQILKTKEALGVGKPLSSQSKIQSMIAENRNRDQLRAEKLQAILSADQYREFLKSQAASSKNDLAIFHGGAD
jgi:hypothetical protein